MRRFLQNRHPSVATKWPVAGLWSFGKLSIRSERKNFPLETLYPLDGRLEFGISFRLAVKRMHAVVRQSGSRTRRSKMFARERIEIICR